MSNNSIALWVHLWLGAPLGDCAFSTSDRHKSNNALMKTATIGPLELAGLVATYASTCGVNNGLSWPLHSSRQAGSWLPSV